MAGDEQSRVFWSGGTAIRKLCDYFASASQQNVGHAVMGANRAAIVQHLFAAPLHSWKIGFTGLAQSKFTRNHFLREITFADEKRHDEHARCKDAAQDSANGRFQFPKRFDDLAEDAAAAQ